MTTIAEAVETTRPKATSGILKNITSNWAALVVNTALSFFIAPIVVHSLGSVSYGIWSLLMQFTGYLWLFDFGVRESVIKYVAEYHASDEREELATTIRTAMSVYAVVAALGLVVAAILAAALPYLFNIPEEAVGAARVTAFLTGATVAQSFLSNVFAGVLMGLQRFYLVARTGILFSVCRALAIFTLLSTGHGIISLALVHLTMSLVYGLLMYRLCTVHLPYVPFRPVRARREKVVKLLNYGKWVLISNIGDKVIFATDAIVIGIFLPISALTYYAIAGTLIGHLRSLIQAMASIFNPLSSSLQARKEPEALATVVRTGSKVSVLLGLPLCIGFILLGERFITLWMGPSYGPTAGQVLAALAIGHVDRSPVLDDLRCVLWCRQASGCRDLADRRRRRQPGAQRSARDAIRSAWRRHRNNDPARDHGRRRAAVDPADPLSNHAARLLHRDLRSADDRGDPVCAGLHGDRPVPRAADRREFPPGRRAQPADVRRPVLVHRPATRSAPHLREACPAAAAPPVTPMAERNTVPRPARILYCESNVDGTIGGSHYCLLHLIENLDRSEFEPIALFYEPHALLDRFRATAETLVLEPHAPVRWGRRGGWRAAPMVLARRLMNSGKFLKTVVDRVAFLRSRRIDLVHLNNSITRHHDWMCAALVAGIPCLTHERGLNPRYTAADRWHAGRLAIVISSSRWILDHMVQRGVSARNMRVLYDGVDPKSRIVTRSAATLRQTWGLESHQPVVGIVGNIREWKGQETVVRAMIEVARERPDVVCFFVGASTPADQPYRDRLDRLIADARIEANVRFTGYQTDVPSFVNLMDFVIHASVQPEPFGMVVLEAMAQRKAVLGSRAGGVVEMVVEGETGYTFPPGDAVSVAARMLELFRDPDRARAMGEAGYSRVLSSFTLDGYMSQIRQTYQAVLGRQPVPAEVGFGMPLKLND